MSTQPNEEFDAEHIAQARVLWCRKYVQVWSDLSGGAFDQEAVEQAADEHWQRSPQSDPVQIAAVEFTKPR